MGVVHRQAAHPREAVDHAALLVAVHGAELEHPQRQVPVAPHPGPVDQHVERAVHRFQVVVLTALPALVVEVHGWEHAVGEPVEVP